MSAAAQEGAEWTFAPYLWIPSIEGTAGLVGMNVPLDLRPDDLIGGLQAGAMGYLRRLSGPHMLYAEGLALDFHDDALAAFRGLPVSARIGVIELGYGYRLSLTSEDQAHSRLALTPYVGVRYAQLDVSVQLPQGPLAPILDPILSPLIPRGKIAAEENWFAPVIGLLLEGHFDGRLGYALKIDGAGFGAGPDDYRSAAAFLTWSASPRWMLALGYRDSHFKAEPGGADELRLDLHASGPKFGFALRF